MASPTSCSLRLISHLFSPVMSIEPSSDESTPSLLLLPQVYSIVPQFAWGQKGLNSPLRKPLLPVYYIKKISSKS
jgi:hypothetical protein